MTLGMVPSTGTAARKGLGRPMVVADGAGSRECGVACKQATAPRTGEGPTLRPCTCTGRRVGCQLQARRWAVLHFDLPDVLLLFGVPCRREETNQPPGLLPPYKKSLTLGFQKRELLSGSLGFSFYHEAIMTRPGQVGHDGKHGPVVWWSRSLECLVCLLWPCPQLARGPCSFSTGLPARGATDLLLHSPQETRLGYQVVVSPFGWLQPFTCKNGERTGRIIP